MVEVVQMSLKEADRYAVIRQVMERTMGQLDAALCRASGPTAPNTVRSGKSWRLPFDAAEPVGRKPVQVAPIVGTGSLLARHLGKRLL